MRRKERTLRLWKLVAVLSTHSTRTDHVRSVGGEWKVRKARKSESQAAASRASKHPVDKHAARLNNHDTSLAPSPFVQHPLRPSLSSDKAP
ncbi:hypothetical protein M438DRAFT_163634 [Aureobasidium pullulans EXF-150]|uniref:Uncharacterized protein n=1 Tax=Aureobasidium pullulans EXF-150 TaxID=1043002 RepID=A0A074XNV1_AURPU|nr:uncharacterized protein M438DRAFT_163634 [Aureobasidium pullulans EXF-150]KEQ87180.1 hypothetical protein M438DRAFT_163634 [Aureobasidium pullulans EXF-150]